MNSKIWLSGALIFIAIGIAIKLMFFDTSHHADLISVSDANQLNAKSDITSKKGAASKSGEVAAAKSVQPSKITKNIWAEFGETSNVAAFYEKYKNWPAGSSERFAAELKVLSCGSLTSVGVDRFYAVAENQKKSLPVDPVADELRKKVQEQHVARCKEFIGVLRPADVKARFTALIATDGIEARALRVAEKVLQQDGASKYISETKALLDTDNPFVVQAMGQIWGKAVQQNAPQIQESIFRGVDQGVAEAAWALASCSYGMDCGKTNEAVLLDCIYSRRCGADTVEDYYQRYRLNPEQMTQTYRLREEILVALRSRNYRSLGI